MRAGKKIIQGNLNLRQGRSWTIFLISRISEFYFSWCLNISVWYQKKKNKKKKNVLFCKDLCYNKLKIFYHLRELNGWSAVSLVNPSTSFIALVDPVFWHTGILLSATTLNILRKVNHWEIYLTTVSIPIWRVVISLFGLLCLLPLTLLFLNYLSFKFSLIFSSWCFCHCNDKPWAENPFCNFVLLLFPLCLFWAYVLFHFIFYFKDCTLSM